MEAKKYHVNVTYKIWS